MVSTQWHYFNFEYILEKEGLSYAQLLFILYTFNHMFAQNWRLYSHW